MVTSGHLVVTSDHYFRSSDKNLLPRFEEIQILIRSPAVPANPISSKIENNADFKIKLIQVEPYLHSGVGQVSFCQEARNFFFEGG